MVKQPSLVCLYTGSRAFQQNFSLPTRSKALHRCYLPLRFMTRNEYANLTPQSFVCSAFCAINDAFPNKLIAGRPNELIIYVPSALDRTRLTTNMHATSLDRTLHLRENWSKKDNDDFCTICKQLSDPRERHWMMETSNRHLKVFNILHTRMVWAGRHGYFTRFVLLCDVDPTSSAVPDRTA